MESNFSEFIEAGIDEAGRGPLCGPVYAAAVIWDKKLESYDKINLIRDSKKLSDKKRKIAFEFLKTNLKYYGIGSATNKEIDKINILEATKLAMKRAVVDLKTKLPNELKIELLIIDGTRWENCFDIKSHSIVKGDDKYYSISAASILAKESHDNSIKEYIEVHPEMEMKYDLSSNKGYGTKKHIEGLEKYGASDYHRRTFKRCQ